MGEAIDLPGLPMTEHFEPHTNTFEMKGRVDNALLFCEPCSHAKLETIVPASELYAKNYKTKTSNSVGSSHSVKSFFAFIERHLDLAGFETVLDIGGNDGSLLRLFRTQKKVNIDPNGSGADIVLMGYIEEVDLQDYKGMRKLIVSSHTLEHLESPEIILEKINAILGYGDYCAFQFPSLDSLVRDARMDQVHHQHIHYFSLRSISLLLAKHGMEIVNIEFDDSHYGTLQIIFRRGLEELKGSSIRYEDLELANRDFVSEMICFDDRIVRLREPVGYGAALMLPLLRYYVKGIDSLSCVYDEDETKHGLRWINLNVPIKSPKSVHGKDVVVCAFNTKLAVRKIVNKLTAEGARNVVVPFHAL